MKTFIAECRRRQVFRVAGLYVVGAWVVLQVAALAFENWAIPNEAMRYVWIGAVAGFPIAILLGWRFNLTGGQIKVTATVADDDDRPLKRADFAILGVATAATVLLAAGLVLRIQQTESIEWADFEPRSVAVLPCTDMSPEGDQAYFGEGIAEELLNLLAKYHGLRVSSRSSSFALQASNLSVPEMARKLNVAHLLECSVRKAGDRIRLTAQLIDGRSDRHEWSETYERDLDDVFAMQDEIAENVVREMKVRLFGAPPAATITDAGAYDTYLHGLSLLARRGSENLHLAEDLFKQVIEVDPDYAPAYASLALTLTWQSGDTADLNLRAEAAANRALELDPDNSDALTVLGFLAGDRDADLDAARSFFLRAIDSNPNNATAYRWLARSYGEENPRRYYSLARKAYFVDPLDPTIHFHLGASSLQLGRFADALAAARQVAMDGDASYGHLQAMNIHQSSGRLDRAIKTAYHNYRVKPKSWSYAAIFWSLIKMGELDLAEAWIEEAKRQVGWSYVEPDDAFLAFLRGDPEKALAMQEAAVERGEINKIQLAMWVIPFTQDFEYAKQLMDDQFAKFEHDPTTFAHDLPTPVFVSYALILQRVGEPEQAAALMREIEASVDAQIDNGIATTEFNGPRAIRAQLHAMRGDSTQAVEALRKLFDDGYSEVDFLTISPYFDKIRDDPGFVSLIADMERRIGDQRRQLIAEGMLLTPSEVAALETFDFDPFEL